MSAGRPREQRLLTAQSSSADSRPILSARALTHVPHGLQAKFCELVCARDFDSALFLVGSHHRIATLRSIWRRVPRAQQASVLADAISSSDFLAPHLIFLILALRSIRARGERLFDGAAARGQFALLPDRITVYRGTVQAEVEDAAEGRSFYGISWTLDRERAIWFTTSRTRNWRSPPVLLTVSVARDDVAGLLVDRKEAEVLLEPARTRHATMTLPVRLDRSTVFVSATDT